jgi:hypothetical protein
MARSDGLIHRKLPPDATIHTRQPLPSETPDIEQTSPGFEALGLKELVEQVTALARGIENRANPVDEYNTATGGSGTATQVVVQPTYEYMPEKIVAIIVCGPAGNVNLLLGDRNLALVIPASGLLVISPVQMLLSRTDARVLTAQTPGPYFLELMGWADRRFNI